MPRRPCPSGALAVVVALTLAASMPAFSALPAAPVLHGMFAPAVERESTIPAAIQARALFAPRVAPGAIEQPALYPSFTWPLQYANHDRVHVVNYVDEDVTAGILDFRGGSYTYDTHRGTDIALHDFRAMDRGVRIVAAAPGTVTYAVGHHARDRNCAEPDDPTLNFLELANGDGTYTYYYHLRANSMTVDVGESVQRGQVLGLVGSSGYSYGPHLHFEAADWLGGPYVRRDPWEGPSNPFPGLWSAQPAYAGDETMRIDDVYVTTETAAGGDLSSVDYCTYFAERMTQPAVLGIHEPYLPVILQFHALQGEAYRIDVRRPDHSLFAGVDYAMPEALSEGIHWWAWYWDGLVSMADAGTWTVEVLVGGLPVRSTAFQVGATSEYGPRFAPRGGRSYRVSGAARRDTLRVSPLGGPVTYALSGAPGSVTLADSVLTIGASSSQTTRSAWFQVIATDGVARRDTAWFHLVDPSKPQEPLATIEETAPHALAFSGAFPSPARGAVTFRFALPRVGRASLVVHDLAGRRVRELLDGSRMQAVGGGDVVWDGRDERGARVPAGIYFASLVHEDRRIIRRVVMMQ